MIKITGLWVNKDKNDKTYYSGYFGNAKVLIFKNTYKKEGTKEPDANLYIAEKQKQAEGEQTEEELELN